MRSSTAGLALTGIVLFSGAMHEASAKPPFGIPGGGNLNNIIRGEIPGAQQFIQPGNLIKGRLGSVINSVANQAVSNYVRPELLNSGYVAPHYLYPGVNNGANVPSVLNQRSIRGYSYSQLSGAPAPGTAGVQLQPQPQPTPANPNAVPQPPEPAPAPAPAPINNGRMSDEAQGALDFAARGESEFRMGNYKGATRQWRHALLDSPQNGVLLLLVAQGQFAQGQYAQAALSTYDAIEVLPEEHWGVVASNYKTLYGNQQHYTDQLRALEKKAGESPNDPVLRFLVGYQYGCIGYPKNAVQELDKVLPHIPEDAIALKYRNVMAVKAGVPPIEPPKVSQR